ncbi:GtrA family protein [Devosia lacusdianchii]|jgi:energy-coupling factor transport system substrate-specific component|uniref:GtrA family protein n=1 Tax=Devosia lacusdianchii TaxID=2917991 RepID=UPI001F06A73D|nr:GtrA family protein [Devosia sp. JXJ CY 41]
MLALARRLTENQVVRFLLLGGTAAAINWIVRFPLAAIMPMPAAVVIAYMIGMSAGFGLYRKYVFPGSNRPVVEQTATFIGVNIVGAVVVLALTTLLLQVVASSHWPIVVQEGFAHGIAIGIGAVINFFGHKQLTFRLAPTARPAE